MSPPMLSCGLSVASATMAGGGKWTWPPLSTMLVVGDSISDRMSVPVTTWGGYVGIGLDGWGAALEAISGQRIKSLARGATGVGTSQNDRDHAYSGISAKQYLLGSAAYGGSEYLGDHVPIDMAVTAAENADVIICHIGANDQPGVTSAQRASRIAELWAALVATGKPVVGTDILPRGTNHSGGWTAEQQDHYDEANAILRSSWRAAGLRAYRQWADLIDADENGVALATEFPTDGLHPTQRVGFKLGRDLYELLGPHVAGTPLLPPASGDAAWLTPNPYVAGGTTLATSWANGSMGTENTDWSASKVTDEDGRVWQRINLITAKTGANVGPYARITSGMPDAGTVCRVCARMRVVDATALTAVSLHVQQVNVTPAYNVPITLGGVAANAESPIGEQAEMLLISDPFTIQSGLTQLWVLIGFRSTGAATIDFREAGIFSIS
jgi:hypothetical protein